MKISKKLLLLITSISIALVGVPKSYALSSVDKIQGIDRYETAGKIADKQNYDTVILVNSDQSLADGLSAAGLSGATNSPILLVQKNKIPQATNTRLKGVKKVFIIGEKDAISNTVENELKINNIQVERIGGTDRIQTSVNVSNKILSIKSVDKILLVNGYKGEADAMSGSAVAARDGVPIILTDGYSADNLAKNAKIYALGEKNVISENLVKEKNAIRIGGKDRFETNKKVIKEFYTSSRELYLSKGYKLVDALTVSSLAKDKPVVLVNNGSDKSILKNATKLIALGGVDETTIQQCINITNGKGNPITGIIENDSNSNDTENNNTNINTSSNLSLTNKNDYIYTINNLNITDSKITQGIKEVGVFKNMVNACEYYKASDVKINDLNKDKTTVILKFSLENKNNFMINTYPSQGIIKTNTGEIAEVDWISSEQFDGYIYEGESKEGYLVITLEKTKPEELKSFTFVWNTYHQNGTPITNNDEYYSINTFEINL
ncbi:cell wall-binding repeat-containing protein [Romboutsia maritimum]|uniref:Cell wall-binding repeat-containing protein n=1 Tax=Romboutsia maritimum TaxID=2020948 RepID=A0A371IRL2_9FIRM|nr:cell wall-binding repeat-containing protein [Romboutsia maritimum]RDY23112.1 cell wall-binding repeat-containing protein [Romboutsia maritimum]